MSEKKNRNEYFKEYRKNNPKKIKEIIERHWKKKLLLEVNIVSDTSTPKYVHIACPFCNLVQINEITDKSTVFICNSERCKSKSKETKKEV